MYMYVHVAPEDRTSDGRTAENRKLKAYEDHD